MIFSKKECIGGISAKRARTLMRELRLLRVVTLDALEHFAGTEPAESAQLITELINRGWLIASNVDAEYTVTRLGTQACAARIGNPITRATADELVEGVLSRVEAWNNTPDVQLIITELKVFGSYLGDKPTLGDIDLSFNFRLLYKGAPCWDVVSNFAEKNGIGLPYSYLALLDFWSTCARRKLKGRKSAISFCGWGTLMNLDCAHQTIYKEVSLRPSLP
ncbi:MAG: hypothetical protein Q7S87_16195 [Agitococcus sp.]|nr:hypothetical protein [Agitococcus sp.]